MKRMVMATGHSPAILAGTQFTERSRRNTTYKKDVKTAITGLVQQ